MLKPTLSKINNKGQKKMLLSWKENWLYLREKASVWDKVAFTIMKIKLCYNKTNTL